MKTGYFMFSVFAVLAIAGGFQTDIVTDMNECMPGIQKCYNNFILETPKASLERLCVIAPKAIECLNKFQCYESQTFRRNLYSNILNIVESRGNKCNLPQFETILMRRPPVLRPTSAPVKKEVEVNLTRDIANVAVENVNAEYVEGTKVFVSWTLPSDVTPAAVEGFKIIYNALKKASKSDDIVEDVSTVPDDDGLYSTTLTLKRTTRYEIKVKPYNGQGEGQESEPVFIYVSGKKLAVTEQLSVRAEPLSPTAAVVSYDVLGGSKAAVDFFYAQENDTEWTQVSKDSVEIRGDKSFVLSGLEPGTVYFVFAKGWMGESYQTSSTSMQMPDNYETNLNRGSDEALKLIKGTGGESVVTWSRVDLPGVQGYKTTITFNAESDSDRRTEVQYLPKEETSIEFEDGEDTVDHVKVEPFDIYGLRGSAEMDCVRCNNTSQSDPALPAPDVSEKGLAPTADLAPEKQGPTPTERSPTLDAGGYGPPRYYTRQSAPPSGNAVDPNGRAQIQL